MKNTRMLEGRRKNINYGLIDGDEYFPNGIFKFHITKLIESIDECVEEFLIVEIDVNVYHKYFYNEAMNPDYVAAADLSRPVILAEIAPDRLSWLSNISNDYYSRGYNLIDGHHRL